MPERECENDRKDLGYTGRRVRQNNAGQYSGNYPSYDNRDFACHGYSNDHGHGSVCKNPGSETDFKVLHMVVQRYYFFDTYTNIFSFFFLFGNQLNTFLDLWSTKMYGFTNHTSLFYHLIVATIG